MQAATITNRDARTYLMHHFGRGLDDQRYVVERFQSMADGEIRPRRPDERSKGGRKEPRRSHRSPNAR